MVQVLGSGAYLVNGVEIIPDDEQAGVALKAKTGREISKESARKGTIAYGILEKHNTSGNMDKLRIKFDKLTSHDITFVGIIQTARASGLTKFPIPYVLTNCHNSLSYVWTDLRQEVWRCLCTSSSGSHPSVCERNAGWRRQDDPGK